MTLKQPARLLLLVALVIGTRGNFLDLFINTNVEPTIDRTGNDGFGIFRRTPERRAGSEVMGFILTPLPTIGSLSGIAQPWPSDSEVTLRVASPSRTV